MKKVYTISCDMEAGLNYFFEREINEIIQVLPDEIIIDSITEYDPEFIFQNFIPKIQPWLEQNNKFVKIIVQHIDRHLITPNIITEQFITVPTRNLNIITKYYYINKFPIENTSKLFTCYNNNCKKERAMLVDQLVKENLLDLGIVTFKKPKELQYLDYTWKYHDGSILSDELDFELHSKDEYMPDVLPKQYLNGFIDIVTESEYTENQFFVTEKTIKPIATLKPFMVLSSSNYHTSLLRDTYGLELYTEIFDYSFDSSPLVEVRIEGIINNIKNLQNLLKVKSKEEIYNSIFDKLNYNREKLKKINCKITTPDLLPKSLKFLLSGEKYKLFGKQDRLAVLDNFRDRFNE